MSQRAPSMATSRKKRSESGTSRLPAGKKQMLVILDQSLVKEIKFAAIEDEMKMSDVVAMATRDWLAKRKARRSE